MGAVHLNWVLFATAALVGLVLTPVVTRVARSLGLVDKPNVRKVHRTPVPRVGGIAIVLATMLPLVTLIALDRFPGSNTPGGLGPLTTLLVGATSIAVIGLLDDLFEVPSTYKLLALLIASAAFCASGGAMQTVVVRGHDLFDLGIAAWPVTMLWIALVTVSINFIDGLDGLAGGISLITCVVLGTGAAVGGDAGVAAVSVALAGALLAFLFYNTHPARVFMGDCGSMFIGFLIAGAGAMSVRQIGTTRGLLLPAMTLAVPLFDTLFTMVRRSVLQRRSVFAAERGHVHHRLMDSGLGHPHVVLILQATTLAAATVSIICIFGGYAMALAAVSVFFLGLAGLFRMAGSVRARDTVSAIRRNRALGRETKRYQTAFYDLQLRFREVNDFEGWWKVVCHAADVFDFAKIDLPLTRRDGSDTILRWRRDGEPLADANSITADVPIPQRRSEVSLRASIEVRVSDFLESGGQRVALFSRLMGEFGLSQIFYKKADATIDRARAAQAMTPAVNPGPLPELRVALVHDFLYTYAGAERVLEQMLAVFPQAGLFSLFDFLAADNRGFIGNRPVTSSFLQTLPFARKKHRAFLPLMPLAIEQLDVSDYDLVISSSYMAAKGVITRPDQLHVCYCHTPVRFAWDLQNRYLSQVGMASGLRSMMAKLILHYIRSWDVRSANGVDIFLANSDFVGRRIQKVYRRNSTTVYPPVDTQFFSPGGLKEDFYLTASRLVPYKRIDLIVEAFAGMPDRQLVVIGEGPELDRIRAKSGPNVKLVGHQTAESLRLYLQQARAFVFAAEEDFGIAPVEAQACGTPVIAFGRGGVTESVVDGQTGLFFEKQDTASIVDAVERFEAHDWDPAAIRRHAEKFSVTHFRDRLAANVQREWSLFAAYTAGGESPAEALLGRLAEASKP